MWQSLISKNEKKEAESVAGSGDPSNEAGADARLLGVSRRRLLFKLDIRLMTLVTLAYLLSYIDRSNVGNARIMNEGTGDSMLEELHMSSAQFQIMQSLFVVSYSLFDIPSNILLKRIRPSRWFAFLLFCWSVLTIGFAGVKNVGAAYAVRLLIGVFESGLYPGIMFYLSLWYRIEEYTIRNTFVLDSGALAGAFGGLIAYGVSYMNGIEGLTGWNWLFIIEGCASAVCAVLLLFFLPDNPENARFLSENERALAVERVKANEPEKEDLSTSQRWQRTKTVLLSPRYLLHYTIYFSAACTLSALSTFSPTIVAGLGYTNVNAQLYTVPPYVVAWAFALVIAYVADLTDKRGVLTVLTALVGAAGFLASGILPGNAYEARYGCLFVAAMGSFAFTPCASSWLVSNIRDKSQASLIMALNNSFGGAGQILGLWVYKSNEETEGYPTGMYTNAAMCFWVVGATAFLLLCYHRSNKKAALRDEERKLWSL